MCVCVCARARVCVRERMCMLEELVIRSPRQYLWAHEKTDITSNKLQGLVWPARAVGLRDYFFV